MTLSGIDGRELACLSIAFRRAGREVLRKPVGEATKLVESVLADEVEAMGDPSGKCPWETYTIQVNPVRVVAGRATFVFVKSGAAGGSDGKSYPTGDLNHDCVVDDADMGIWQAAYQAGKKCGEPGFDARADLDGNCKVDLIDFEILRRHMGERCP